MHMNPVKLMLLAVLVPLWATACAVDTQTAGAIGLTAALQVISAGRTGCAPTANHIAQVDMQLNGSGTWQATCAGRTYLCSAFQGVNPSDSYSCAPEVAAPDTVTAATGEPSATTQALQMVSAGHTGCVPAANHIAQMDMQLNGNGTWQATCAGRTYLCSAFKGVNPSVSYSCALAVAPADPGPQ